MQMSLSNLPKELFQSLAADGSSSNLTGKAPSSNDSSTTSTTTNTTAQGNTTFPFSSMGNTPSFSNLPSLTHLGDHSLLGQSSEALNFLLNSTDIHIGQNESQQPGVAQVSFEELFSQQHQAIQKQQQLLQALSTKIASNTPEPEPTRLEAPKLENLPALSQTLAKWGDYQKPHEEVIGQIIQKRSQEKEEYIDISTYVTFPQHEAARRLGIPSSTLSKKWKDATVNRKWPYRALAKIDKEIATIMHNIPKNADGSLDPEVEQQLAVLLRKRQMEARTVIIRLN